MVSANNEDLNSSKTKIFNVLISSGIYITLILLFIIFSLSSPTFLTGSNIMHFVSYMSIVATISIGQTFVIAGRGIDLSGGSVLAFTGLLMGSLYFDYNINPILVMIIGLAAATATGFINGIIIAKTGVPDLIVTLAAMEVWRGVAYVLFGATIYDRFPASIVFLGGGRIGVLPKAITSMIILALIAHFILKKTRAGRHILAIGGNRKAAEFVGISYVRQKVYSYMFSGFFCGMATIIYIGQLNAVRAGVGYNYPLYSVAAVIVGGTSLFGGSATILGTVVGVLVLGIIRNGLINLGVPYHWFMVIVGNLIILIIALSLWRKRRKS